MKLSPRLASHATLTATARGWVLSIPAGPANRYRLSQLDDHLKIPRSQYPWRPPVRMQLEARVSGSALPGTWGFGFWNDPYGFSFGPGSGFLRLPALPNAAWFFFSSPVNHLSFRDDRPGNGFLAQVFASPPFHPLLFRAGLAFPFSPKAARNLLSRVIQEDSVRLDAKSPSDDRPSLELDVTQWHSYGLEWTSAGSRFLSDGICVLETSVSPRPPMGLVIWIDNQHAGFTPEGKVSFGLEANPQHAWLEIRDLTAGSMEEQGRPG